MKRQIGTMLLSCVLSAALLGGCAITIAPASEAAAQSTIDNDEPSSASFPDGPASPTGTPSPTAVEPTPESTRSEPVVYAPGRIADDGDALFEVPDGLDADHFHNFALYLTIAIKSPLESIENADSETAFRLSRCMLECFYRTHPDIWDQVVYREEPDGYVRNYTVIPISDFLDFTATHLGLDTLDFFKNAIPADDAIVRFDEESNEILFVPSLESTVSDFETGHVEVEGSTMCLCASSESKGERVYIFDISDGIDQYRLIKIN